jgi:hypothetical protein
LRVVDDLIFSTTAQIAGKQSAHNGKAFKSQYEKQNFMLEKKPLIFSTYLSSRAKNVHFITRLAPPRCTLDKPSFFAHKNKCVKKSCFFSNN